MKYALLLMGHVDDPAVDETGCASPEEFFAFDEEITAAGIVVSSFALEDPDQGVVVHSDENGERVVSTGPLAEVREFVGGTYIIEVADVQSEPVSATIAIAGSFALLCRRSRPAR